MENSLARLGRRIALLFRLRMHDRGMDEEMRFHMEMGGLERRKETGRDARGVRIAEDEC